MYTHDSRRTRTITSTALTALVAMMLAPMAFGAATTGTIQGTVTNASGQPVVGATVTLESTGATSKTDSSGNYTFTGVDPSAQAIRISGGGAYKPTETTINVSQDVTSRADVTLESNTIKTGTSIIRGQAVPRADSSTNYGISAAVEQQTKSQPNNLYQFPGLVFGQPGITPDPSGYVHIRGSDFNQVGFDVDGIQITEPMTNSFATNLVTVGLKSANLYTGGADASYGNATGGFINEVTQNGRDLRGGIIEGTFGPAHGWNYRGTNSQYGNVIGNKADYYFSTIQFANSFPGNTQIQKLGASFDGVAKVNYYADPNNQVTGFLSHGFEQYDNYQPFDATNTSKFDPNVASAVKQDSFQQDHSDQQYDLNYLGYKHNFSPKSFLNYRAYQLKNDVTFHGENTGGFFENRHSSTFGNQFDYTNQLSDAYQLKAGVAYLPSNTFYHLVVDNAVPLVPVSSKSPRGYLADRISTAKANQTVLYLSNQVKAMNDQLTLTLGLRYANMHYGLQDLSQVKNGDGSGSLTDAHSFDDHYVDPRLGIAYSPVRDLVIRSSYAVESQFPDSRLPEILFPQNTGTAATSTNPAVQLKGLQGRYAQYNRLGASHANNFDLGIEKGLTASGLGFLNGTYSAALTGYTRRQYDLIQLTRVGYGPSADGSTSLHGVRGYDNSGHGRASGLEFKLAKSASLRNPYAINGFVSYTNQVVRATSSDFDTGYASYFYNAFAGSEISDAAIRLGNGQEYATSYDQRHTIGVDVTKRFNKTLESSIILDAGSGFPFSGGSAGLVGGQGSDSQHTVQAIGAASYQEVPVTLFDRTALQPLNPTAGRSGWHYKISLNTNFYLTPTTSLFFDVDNVFNKQTVLNYATSTQAGTPYYESPSAAFPQGRIYYGASTIITPVFATFGFRTKF